MAKILRNDNSKISIRSEFDRHANRSRELLLAAPYFDHPELCLASAVPDLFGIPRIRRVSLLIGLNSATNPDALSKIFGQSGIEIRYFRRWSFHAKIYCFDEAAMLGSANLTRAGFTGNVEAVACFDAANEDHIVRDIRAFFAELWDRATDLNRLRLDAFTKAWRKIKRSTLEVDPDQEIEKEISLHEPSDNASDRPRLPSPDRGFDDLCDALEGWRSAFQEISNVLEAEGLERSTLVVEGRPFHTYAFLDWVAWENVLSIGHDDNWTSRPLLENPEARRSTIIDIGRDWQSTSNDRVRKGYKTRLDAIAHAFGDRRRLADATSADLTSGLKSIGAFNEATRRDGAAFWQEFKDNAQNAKVHLDELLFGTGDIVSRVYAIVYDHRKKIPHFGIASAVELAGTVLPAICSQANGRAARAMRFIGFNVQTNI